MTKVVSLPYSHPLAEKRFRRNPKFLKDCKEFMKNVVKSYVDKAPTDCLDVRDGKVNSVPHTGLYHPREPECIGVVYISYIRTDRKSTRLNSSHANISYAVFCLKKKKNTKKKTTKKQTKIMCANI